MVHNYCRSLGVTLGKKGYENNTQFMGLAEKMRAAGKTSADIASHLNEAGFRTTKGETFTGRIVWSMFHRMGRNVARNALAEDIIKEIRLLAEGGYHPRTIAIKLNQSGLKTLTGKKFGIRHVQHYLRKMKASGKKKIAAEMLDQVAESKSAARTSDGMKKGVLNVG